MPKILCLIHAVHVPERIKMIIMKLESFASRNKIVVRNIDLFKKEKEEKNFDITAGTLAKQFKTNYPAELKKLKDLNSEEKIIVITVAEVNMGRASLDEPVFQTENMGEFIESAVSEAKEIVQMNLILLNGNGATDQKFWSKVCEATGYVHVNDVDKIYKTIDEYLKKAFPDAKLNTPKPKTPKPKKSSKSPLRMFESTEPKPPMQFPLTFDAVHPDSGDRKENVIASNSSSNSSLRSDEAALNPESVAMEVDQQGRQKEENTKGDHNTTNPNTKEKAQKLHVRDENDDSEPTAKRPRKGESPKRPST